MKNVQNQLWKPLLNNVLDNSISVFLAKKDKLNYNINENKLNQGRFLNYGKRKI